MALRQRLLIRLGRALKGDQAFDIDPAIGGFALAGAMLRRGTMAMRGLLLAARSGRFAFPVFVGRGVVHNKRHLKLSSGVTIEDFCRLDCLGTKGIELAKGSTPPKSVIGSLRTSGGASETSCATSSSMLRMSSRVVPARLVVCVLPRSGSRKLT